VTASASLGICIATTAGPVEVQRITEEDPEVDSVVCLAGKAMPLPISANYENFVRQPTGVVQRLFGHASYRVDLAETIEDGYSWQLGILLAHAARAGDRLMAPSAGAENVVIATGEVDFDLNILPVDHLAAKLDRASGMVAALARDGVRVTLVVPAGNGAEIDDAWLSEHRLGAGVCRLVRAETFAEALSEIGADGPDMPATPPVVITEETRSPGGVWRLFGGGGVVFVALAAISFGLVAAYFADWRALAEDGRLGELDQVLGAAEREGGLVSLKAALFQRWLEYRGPGEEDVAINVIEHRAPEGQSCAAVRFGQSKPRERKVPLLTPREFEAGVLRGLCALEIIAAAESEGIFLWGRYERGSASGRREFDEVVVLGPSPGRLRWKIRLPRRLPEDLEMRVRILAARHPVDGTTGWLAKNVPGAGRVIEGAAWWTLARKLTARGVSIREAAYRLRR